MSVKFLQSKGTSMLDGCLEKLIDLKFLQHFNYIVTIFAQTIIMFLVQFARYFVSEFCTFTNWLILPTCNSLKGWKVNDN